MSLIFLVHTNIPRQWHPSFSHPVYTHRPLSAAGSYFYRSIGNNIQPIHLPTIPLIFLWIRPFYLTPIGTECVPIKRVTVRWVACDQIAALLINVSSSQIIHPCSFGGRYLATCRFLPSVHRILYVNVYTVRSTLNRSAGKTSHPKIWANLMF